MRTIMKLLLSIMFILGLGLATSGTAYADPPSANKPTSQGELGQCAPAAENNRIVPEQRWRDSIPHLITSSEGTGWFGGNFNIGSMMQSGSTTQILDWGSFLWGTAIDLTEASQRFCILYRVGGSLDRAAAAIGNILFGGALTGTPFEGLPIGVLVLLFIIGVNLVKSLKGQAVWREVLRCAAALALMIIMVGIPGTGIGAVNSTGAGAGGESVGLNTPDNYVPAPLSPGWFITQINNVVASVVAMPTEQMNNMTTSIQSSLLFGDEAGSPLGCVHYVATLEDIYGVYAGEKNLPDASVSVTLAASKLWEVSAVNAWRKIQFDGAALGDKVWCRVLDGWRSFDNDGWAPPALTQLQSLRDQGFQFRTVSPNSLAFIKTGSGSGGTTTGSERNRAAQAVAWAACEWTGDGNSPLDGAWKWSNSYLVPAAAVNNNEAEAKCDGLFTAEDWTADGWLPKSLSNKDIDAYLDEPRDGVSDGKMKSEARAFLIRSHSYMAFLVRLSLTTSAFPCPVIIL